MSLYTDLCDAGCVLDSHESDLYVQDTPMARKILARYPDVRPEPFMSQTEPRGPWLDIPFAFDPFWERRVSRNKAATTADEEE